MPTIYYFKLRILFFKYSTERPLFTLYKHCIPVSLLEENFAQGSYLEVCHCSVHICCFTHICLFFLSLIIPHPWRKTVSWVMSNNFVIKCCSVCIEWLSALMNGSMPYNRSRLTFCSRPCCHLLLFFLPDAS